MQFKASTITTVAFIAGLAAVCHPAAAAAAEPPLEKDFNYDDALRYYHAETAALLKQSLFSAGFAIDETDEVDEIYLDFAERALNAEKERIERIRDALKTQQQQQQQQMSKTQQQQRHQPMTIPNSSTAARTATTTNSNHSSPPTPT
mmetsp:Transcript_11730/g.16814  ORF Transcript_11730/g.16814 Transcript_11730/m.16814 type:complete len:147 (-) Transcript_11730:461-901(-)